MLPQLQLAAPLVILASIWVGAAPVLTANTTLHSLRDVVLGVTKLEKMSRQQAYRIRDAALWNSYVPLLAGILLFLSLLTSFVIVAASNLELPHGQESFRTLCYFVALQPGFAFVGFLWGGGRDILTMRRKLDDELRKLQVCDARRSAKRSFENGGTGDTKMSGPAPLSSNGQPVNTPEMPVT